MFTKSKFHLHFFSSAGLAILSICLALIQEQIAKRATRAMNKDQEKVRQLRVVFLIDINKYSFRTTP